MIHLYDNYWIGTGQYSFQLYFRCEDGSDHLLLDEWRGEPGDRDVEWTKRTAIIFLKEQGTDWKRLGRMHFLASLSGGEHIVVENYKDLPNDYRYKYDYGYEEAREEYVSPYREAFVEKLKQFLLDNGAELVDNDYGPPALFLTIDDQLFGVGGLRMGDE